MFTFEKFPVYLETQKFILLIQPILKNRKINFISIDQLYRASSSILLNIAEGAGKFSKKDKKNFYIIARGSTHECLAALDLLKLEENIDLNLYDECYSKLQTISKMLSGLIKKMNIG